MITPYDLSVINKIDYAPLKSKRILITGGTGFVGRWLELAPVAAMMLSQYSYGSFPWFEMDWDYILHLAPTSPDLVIKCARQCGAKVLYASSGATTDRDPKDYAIGKLRAEDDLLQSGVDVRIARLYTFAGAYMANRYAAINYIHDAIETRTIKIRGSRKIVRTYLYAADMAAWIWAILLKGKPGTTYNVGAEAPVTMEQLAQEVQKNFDHPYIEDAIIYTHDERPYYVPDVVKTKMDCGVDVWTPFEETIKRTCAHYKQEYQNNGE